MLMFQMEIFPLAKAAAFGNIRIAAGLRGCAFFVATKPFPLQAFFVGGAAGLRGCAFFEATNSFPLLAFLAIGATGLRVFRRNEFVSSQIFPRERGCGAKRQQTLEPHASDAFKCN